MPILERETVFPGSADAVFRRFCDVSFLNGIGKIGPFFQLRTENRSGKIRQGAHFYFQCAFLFLSFRYESLIQNFDPGKEFVEVQTAGLLRTWWHLYRFSETHSGIETCLKEKIYYEVPFGWFGKGADIVFIRPMLQFWFRHRNKLMEVRLPGLNRNNDTVVRA